MPRRWWSPLVSWDDTAGEDVPWWRAEAPHSAVHTSATPEDGADASGRARTRAGAREGSGAAAHPQPHSAVDPMPTQGDGNGPADAPDTVVQDADAPGGRWVPATPGWAQGLAAPDWWALGPPSLAKVWAFASRGEWTSPTGLPRLLGRAYAVCVAVPAISVLHSVAWITAWGGSRVWQAPQITPGDLVSDDMPALAAIWQAVTASPVRGGGRAYAFAAIPLIAVCYASSWTVERFSRLAVVLALPGLALGLIPLPWT